MERFFAILFGKGVDEGKEDKVCWLEVKSGSFSFRSLYSSLERGDLSRSHLVSCGKLGST